MRVFLGIAYFVIGIVQFFAIMDGIAYALDIGKFFSAIIAFFITYIPLVGSIAGVYGAVEVWDWSLLKAALLFFWYVPVLLGIYLVLGIGVLLNRN